MPILFEKGGPMQCVHWKNETVELQISPPLDQKRRLARQSSFFLDDNEMDLETVLSAQIIFM